VLASQATTDEYDPSYSMNVRDPFDTHRSPAFNTIRGTATNITQRVREASTKAYDTSKQAVEDLSSFAIPQSAPSFTDPPREMENKAWGTSGVTARSHNGHTAGSVISGMQDRVGNLFEGNRDLPMYKDKPYSYASPRRRKSLWRRKRVLLIATPVVLFVLYFLGLFTSDGDARKDAQSRWSFLRGQEKSGAKADWMERREKVKQAFTLSWDAYERYAWGKLISIQVVLE
jgi:hypothetical protein